MKHNPEQPWNADSEAYWALQRVLEGLPQEGEDPSQRPTSSILEAITAATLVITALLFMTGLVAIGTIWWLDTSDCGDHSTWSCGL